MAQEAKPRVVAHQPSWRVASRDVEAFVTVAGGQLGPVTFDRRRRAIRPYHVAPWAGERLESALPVLRALRGDFFCMPFGANAESYRGERHALHGETANRNWTFESLRRADDQTTLHLSMDTRVRTGRVDKYVRLIDGHNVLYCRHVISGMTGAMNFGHHAMLRFPDAPGSGVISTSRILFGATAPEPIEQPANRGYSLLKPDATFKSLSRVATVTGEAADLTHYPARRGYEDVVQVVADPRLDLAWTAVVFPAQRFAWFALKDPRVLPTTLFWLSNGGRHYPPWSGRHVNVMGLEEVCGYFHLGLQRSAVKNPLSEKGITTAHRLDPAQPMVVNYIMAVTPVPAGFQRVRRIAAISGGVRLFADTGRRVDVPLDTAFVRAVSD